MKLPTIVALIVINSVLHYITPIEYLQLHAIYQRLYYVPIIITAYRFGFRWGLGTAFASGVLYMPHILFQWGAHMPHEAFTQYVEVGMFFVVASLVGILSDIQRVQQTRIVAAQEQIRRMDRLSLLGQLAAGLAHEIRNPLGSLIGSAEILRSNYESNHEKQEFVDILHKELLRLRDNLNHFLRFARPVKPELVPNSINDIVRETVTLTAEQANRAKVLIDINLDKDIPLVPMDSEQLKQVLLNLLLNALDAMPKGGNVKINTFKMVDGIGFAVSDTGSGIPPGKFERIFEPFYTTKEKGTGLGLAIVKQLVEGMGGTVAVMSQEGGGVKFEVCVKCCI